MLRIKNKLLAAILSVVICIVTISPHISAYAETTTIPVPGTIYDTGEKGDYVISDDSITEEFNSFGTFSITGDLVQTDSVGGIDVYTASSGSVDFNYKYSLSSNEERVFKVNNSDVVDAVTKLTRRLNGIEEHMDNLQVFLDSSTLVGGIKSPLNKEFGKMMVRTRRGKL